MEGDTFLIYLALFATIALMGMTAFFYWYEKRKKEKVA